MFFFLVSEIDLSEARREGFQSPRRAIWKACLDTAEKALKENKGDDARLDEDSLARAIDSINALRTTSSARGSTQPAAAMSVHKYYYENKLCSSLSRAVVDLLPFDVRRPQTWHSKRLQDASASLSDAFHVLQTSKSLILRSFPVAAVAGIIDTLQEFVDSRKARWWGQRSNDAIVLSSCEDVLGEADNEWQSAREGSLRKKVEAAVKLFTQGIKHLDCFNGTIEMKNYGTVVQDFSAAVSALNRNEQEIIVSLSVKEVQELLKQVKVLDEELAVDVTAQLEMQTEILDGDTTSTTLERYCWMERKAKRVTAGNGILRDLANCTESICKFWCLLSQSSEIDKLVEQIEVDTTVSSGLGMVCQLAELLSDMNCLEIDYDYGDIVNGIVEKISEDGTLANPKRLRPSA